MAKVALLMLLLAIKGAPASDRLKGWSDWPSEGKALRNAGDYPAAVGAFRQALAGAEGSGMGERQLVEIHDSLAAAYAEAGLFAEAGREYRRGLALVEKADGRESLAYALLLGSMALLPTEAGGREEAIQLLREAIAVNQKTASARDLAVLRNCLALIFRKEGRYQEEEPLLVDALGGLVTQKRWDPKLLGGTLNDLAVLRFDQGRYGESAELYRESLRVLGAALGGEHPSLVVPSGNLAADYVKLGRLEDASSAYQRAIGICGKSLGESHPVCGSALGHYAVVLRKLGQKREAKRAEAQSQRIKDEAARRNGVGATISVSALSSK